MHSTITLCRDGTTDVFTAQTCASQSLQISAPPQAGVAPAPASTPSPMEVLLSGAAACSAYDVVQLLRARGIALQAITVSARAERATQPPKVFTAIALHYRIQAPSASLQELQAVVRESIEHHCSAIGMLRHSARISAEVERMADT